MALYSCNCRGTCTGAAIIASIVIGILTAFLRLTAVITVPPVFLWVTFGIAIVYLAVTLLAAAIAGRGNTLFCESAVLPSLLVGILGTILLSVVLLAIEFVATSVIGAILTGGLLLFFSLTVSVTACLVKCLVGYRE